VQGFILIRLPLAQVLGVYQHPMTVIERLLSALAPNAKHMITIGIFSQHLPIFRARQLCAAIAAGEE